MHSTERNEAILKQLENMNTKVTLFVCGKRIDSKEGENLLKKWDNQGHTLANHTYSHFYYNNPQLSFSKYAADILKNEQLIQNYTHFKKLFRFPFLKAGNTKTKRDHIRSFLNKQNYRYGYVTIDASDWYISQRLEDRLKKDPSASVDGFRKYYLDHMWERAQYYDNLAKGI